VRVNTTLTADEVRFQLQSLGEHLTPADLRLLLQIAGELSAADHGLGVDQALAKLYPQHEHKAATDALGKLRARLALAAKTDDRAFELTVSGSKKGGAAGRALSFKGESRMAQTVYHAMNETQAHYVKPRAVSFGSAVVLLVTVNANESAAVLAAFVAPGVLPKPVDRQGRTYQELGRHGDFRVVHTTCEMGSVGPGAALIRVTRAIDDWRPEVVIGVGIAFGVDPVQQKFGDVLIAKKIESYELQRVGAKGKLLRGDRVTASTRWLNRFRLLNEGQCHAGSGEKSRLAAWPRVQFDLMLSGEKLVDDLDYRESLQQAAQNQAIGGEMEGAGIYAAAADTKTDWMIVKGISDWADGSKAGATPEQKAEAEAMQRLAAANAARVVRAALTSEPLPGQTETPPDLAFDDHRHETEYPNYEATKGKFTRPRAMATQFEKNALDSATSQVDPAAGVDAQTLVEQWLHRADAAPVFAVLGEYGMGKTVICQRLAQTMNEHRRTHRNGHARRAFYFDLRDLTNLHGSVPTLEKLLAECIARRWKPVPGEAPLTPAHVMQAHAQGALVIFDGLDEVLVHYDGAPGQTFTRELLSLVKPGSLGRVLLSCRTQFFRTLREQTNHLTGEDRSDKTARAYEAMTLLPFTEEQIKTYLNLAVPGADVNALIEAIAAVHNLTEMAQRPYTLSLIVDFLPDLERLRAAGKPVYGVTLYRNMVRSWLERDAGKHHIKPDHKMKLAAHLAADLWRQGQRLIEAEHLETWFGRWLRADADLSDRYRDLSRDKLEEDLRNSTFLSRQDGASEEQSGFRFAHTSMQEFFVALYLFDAPTQR
jgi:nucleoside phosphorylase